VKSRFGLSVHCVGLGDVTSIKARGECQEQASLHQEKIITTTITTVITTTASAKQQK